jgi:uncharacterized membrane protein
MEFEHVMDVIVRAFEALGVAIFVIGAVFAAGRYVLTGLQRAKPSLTALRHDLGRSILLGLEILIIADIIATITVDLSLRSAASLGIIVLVRTFLSFSLSIELEGTLPWRRGPGHPAPPDHPPPPDRPAPA